jgi:hypothetical protein
MPLILLDGGRNTDNWRARKGCVTQFSLPFLMPPMRAMLSPKESIHFDDLEFIATSSGELVLSPTVPPIHANHFGIKDFAADRLSMLHLSGEGGSTGRWYEPLLDISFTGVVEYMPPSFHDATKGTYKDPSSFETWIGGKHSILVGVQCHHCGQLHDRWCP